MAYFEIFESGGINDALAVGSDSEITIPAGERVDILVYNQSQTSVTVYLVTDTDDLDWSDGAVDHEPTRLRSEYRSVEIDNSTGLGANFLTINRLAPGATYICRLTNVHGTNTYNWLDLDSCRMQDQGHGTNVHDGQFVYVFGGNPASA